MENSTELIVAPFKQSTQERGSVPNKNEPNMMSTSKMEPGQNSLYQRLFNKDINQAPISSKTSNVIDSRTLDNVSSSIDDDDSSESTKSSETMHEEKSYCKIERSERKFKSQMRSFKTLLAEISSQDKKIFNFRVIPRVWKNNSQMCDVYVKKPFQSDSHTTFALNYNYLNDNDERVSRDYFVNLKFDAEIGKNSKNTFATIELNDILMAKLKISKFSRVTLTSKNTVLNFLEKIELIPMSNNTVSKKEIIDDFKLLIKKSGTALLINQDQIFKLCGVLVAVKLYPESFRYVLCDAELLRERKIFASDQTAKDLENVLKAADEITSPSMKSGLPSKEKSVIHTNDLVNIVENCVECITVKNCLNEMNQLRKLGNFLIMGKYGCRM